ncbi:hypothetical protein OIDMADRAFT_33764 [Oidiodendron maius Zn]|uniref:Uncharacterized protein n=1 Tax=Oidiodendron maius (strain Zn) TaxID=913774 RepID=A0A0C3D1B1_OIDMZ|nr:hypothetical protein OIDMADRAFT_33764 [Oidiodendron maius Zn]
MTGGSVTTTTSDITWDFVARFIVLTVEISVGIMVGCMPVFPAIFQKSGVTRWWSSTFKSLILRLLGSEQGTGVTSVKKSGSREYKSSGRGDTYVELQETFSN